MPDALSLLTHRPDADWTADALVLPIPGTGGLPEAAAEANSALDGLLAEMLETREFSPDLGAAAVVPTMGRLPARRVLLVGLGKSQVDHRWTLVRAAAAACRAAGRRQLRRVLTDPRLWPGEAGVVAEAVAEGAELSRFVPDPYRTIDLRDNRVTEVVVDGASAECLRHGQVRGRGRNLARELAIEPSNVLDPPEMARRAEEMAAEVGLECTVLDEDAMAELGMESILTVSRGSDTPGRFIVLQHNHGAAGAPPLALIGKAVCFDTGGISLKPSADMGRMKGDMGGAAAVLGAMRAIAELEVPANLLALIPAVLNMPDGKAWRPGDIVRTMEGKTVETISTDAEGRMLLADALCYARRLGAGALVDIATLTGACAVALGQVASGLYGTDPELVEQVRTAGERSGEIHWPMPLLPEYRELIRSDIADLKNSGGRLAGSVTAAMFLKEFAGETPWAHLDIAGAFSSDKQRPWSPAGPTGTGVGTFIDLAAWYGSR